MLLLINVEYYDIKEKIKKWDEIQSSSNSLSGNLIGYYSLRIYYSNFKHIMIDIETELKKLLPEIRGGHALDTSKYDKIDDKIHMVKINMLKQVKDQRFWNIKDILRINYVIDIEKTSGHP